MADLIEAVAPRCTAIAGVEASARVVLAKVAETLKTSGYAALRDVVVEYRKGVLVLRGTVPSFYMKQVAQTVTARVWGVEVLDNRLSVEGATSDFF